MRRPAAIAGQLLRKGVQLGVVGFVAWAAANTIWRNYKVAHNSPRLVGLIHGEGWGKAYELNERALSVTGEPYEASQQMLGMPWASTVFGLTGVDPILFLSHLVQNGGVTAELVVAALLPLTVALLLGKVFCSYLCPMRLAFEVGQLVRGGLLRFGVALPHWRIEQRFGGWVLLGGLISAALTGSAVWYLLLPYTSLMGALFLSVTAGTTAGLLIGPAILVGLDVLFAPGLFCHNLCPQGFVLEQLGRLSVLRLNKRAGEACPTKCRACEQVCPFSLSPREETHQPACNNCGTCVVVCPQHKLARVVARPRLKRALPVIAALLTLLVLPGVVHAHHNKGLPHYGYYENYPQVPTEENVVVVGKWEMGGTIFNFQGYQRQDANAPNDVKFFLYLYDLEKDTNYVGEVRFEIRLDGKTVAEFTRDRVDEENIYTTRETLPASGEYEIVAHVSGEKPVSLPFSIDLGDGGINWALLIGLLIPVVIVFALAWVGRSRKARAQRMKAQAAAGAMVALTAVLPARAQSGDHAHHASHASSAPVAAASAPDSAASASPHGAHSPDSCPHAAAAAKAAGKADSHVGHGDHAKHAGHGDHAKHAGHGDHANHAGHGDHANHAGHGDHANMVHYQTEDGGQVMVMGGVPSWLFLLAVASVIILSFIVVERRGGKDDDLMKPVRGRNLIKNRRIYNMFRSRWFQPAFQLVMVALFAYITYAGLAGNPYRNIAPVAVWTLWWGGLIFAVAVLGPAFCFACPWDGLTNLVTRLRVAARVDTLSLDLPVPSWLQNMWPAILLFVVLSWAELGLGATTNAKTTVYMGLGMAVLAIVSALVFTKKAFCHHLCPVGRITGVYANFSPIQLRARNPRTCEKCTTEDCLHGNDKGYACPTRISLKVVQDSTYCTGCTECIKSCDKYNVALELRPFGSDLHRIKNPRNDEAWMCLVLLALTLFHGFSMTTVWENFAPGSMSLLKWMKVSWGTPSWVNFSVGMLLAMSVPIAAYWLCCKFATLLTRDAGVPTRTLFLQYSFSLLPVALFYHLAHNTMHVFMEAGHIVPLLSDPLGAGTDYFGTASSNVGHLIGDRPMWFIQVALIVVGHIFGVVVAHKISRRVFKKKRDATRSLIPMTAAMVLLSVAGLSLMVLDMNMRVGRM